MTTKSDDDASGCCLIFIFVVLFVGYWVHDKYAEIKHELSEQRTELNALKARVDALAKVTPSESPPSASPSSASSPR